MAHRWDRPRLGWTVGFSKSQWSVGRSRRGQMGSEVGKRTGAGSRGRRTTRGRQCSVQPLIDWG